MPACIDGSARACPRTSQNRKVPSMSEERHDELAIHSLEAPDGAALQSRSRVARRAKILAAIVVVLLAVGAARTVVSRISNDHVLQQGTAERAKVYVNVAAPISG